MQSLQAFRSTSTEPKSCATNDAQWLLSGRDKCTFGMTVPRAQPSESFQSCINCGEYKAWLDYVLLGHTPATKKSTPLGPLGWIQGPCFALSQVTKTWHKWYRHVCDLSAWGVSQAAIPTASLQSMLYQGHDAGISKKAIKLKPVAVVKG